MDQTELQQAIADAVAKERAAWEKSRSWLAPHLASLRADPTAGALALGVGFIAGKWGGVIWGLVGGIFG